MYSSYQNNELLKDRELEAHILTKSANKLRACKQDWENKDKLIETLIYNQRMWIIFQEYLSDKQPKEIRGNILKLIGYIDTRTYKIMSGELKEPRSLDIIISINNGIAKGLRS